MLRFVSVSTAFCAALLLVPALAAGQPAPPLVEAFKQLTRSTPWEKVAAIPVDFDTHHPQGFALVDDLLFVSSVEVTRPTQRLAEPVDGLDRTAGTGKGWLFTMDLRGQLLDSLRLDEGTMYHPGGIDFDGSFIWVPVAEYRPDSRSVVYRVDPVTLESVRVFAYPDHIGGIVHNVDAGTLHGVSWGSRRYYRWTLDDQLEVIDGDTPPESLRVTNPSHYIDYQDCQHTGHRYAICAGLAGYYQPHNETYFGIGGLDLIDLETSRPVHQAPFPFWTERGQPLTQNPVVLELDGTTLRLYAMPEDNTSRLFIYETEVLREATR